MAHSDDNGLILPPKLAPSHIVILPIIHKEEDRGNILSFCQKLAEELRLIHYHNRRLAVEIDMRELPGGEKGWSWVKKGVPIRLEIGNKECASDSVFMGRRDREYKDRKTLSRQEFLHLVKGDIDDIQAHLLLLRALMEFQKSNTTDH